MNGPGESLPETVGFVLRSCEFRFSERCFCTRRPDEDVRRLQLCVDARDFGVEFHRFCSGTFAPRLSYALLTSVANKRYYYSTCIEQENVKMWRTRTQLSLESSRGTPSSPRVLR